MKSSTLLGLLCLFVCHSFAAALNLRWVEYTTKNATVCTHTACRSFVHIVFTADMTNFTDSLVGGAHYSLDGGAKQQGDDIHFERHLVHGTSPLAHAGHSAVQCRHLRQPERQLREY